MKQKKYLKRIKDGQTFIVVMILAVLLLIIIPPVHAQEITITSSGGMVNRDINVYYPNATTGQMDMLGRYNMTSVVSLNGSTPYTFDFVPVNRNPLEDPGDWLSNEAFPFIQTNILGIVAFCVAIAIVRSR